MGPHCPQPPSLTPALTGGGGLCRVGVPFLPYHVLKAPQDSGSDDAQEQANDVEDGGGPEQVVEVDDVLAAADVDVLVVATGDLHPAGWGEAHASQFPGSRLLARSLARSRSHSRSLPTPPPRLGFGYQVAQREKTGGQVGSCRKGTSSPEGTQGARH